MCYVFRKDATSHKNNCMHWCVTNLAKTPVFLQWPHQVNAISPNRGRNWLTHPYDNSHYETVNANPYLDQQGGQSWHGPSTYSLNPVLLIQSVHPTVTITSTSHVPDPTSHTVTRPWYVSQSNVIKRDKTYPAPDIILKSEKLGKVQVTTPQTVDIIVMWDISHDLNGMKHLPSPKRKLTKAVATCDVNSEIAVHLKDG